MDMPVTSAYRTDEINEQRTHEKNEKKEIEKTYQTLACIVTITAGWAATRYHPTYAAKASASISRSRCS